MSNTLKYDPAKISQMYEFMSEPLMPPEAHNAIVFGRKDERVAEALAGLTVHDLVDMAVVTGGIGKDSGNIQELGYDSEAAWLIEQALAKGVDPSKLIKEPLAKNGGENVRNSLTLFAEHGLQRDPVIAVAHATSAFRLAEMIRHETVLAGDPISTIYRVPTAYDFNPNFEVDAKEAFDEYARLVKWPDRAEGPWLQPQTGLDPNLVDYVHDVTAA